MKEFREKSISQNNLKTRIRGNFIFSVLAHTVRRTEDRIKHLIQSQKRGKVRGRDKMTGQAFPQS